MVNEQIVAYIVDNIKKGYKYQEIKNTLVQTGWGEAEVDQAISSVYANSVQSESEQRKSHHVKSIFLVIVFVMVVAFGLYMLNSSFSEVKPIVDDVSIEYELSLSTKKIEVGESIVFMNSFKSPVSLQGYYVYPTYKIYDAKSNIPVMQWTSTDGVPLDSSQEMRKMLLSTIGPGSYYLESQANYKGTLLVSMEEFRVYKDAANPTCSDGIKNQGETDTDCGGPCRKCISCTDGIKNQGETDTDCGGPCKPCKKECLSCNDYDLCTEDTCADGKCDNKPIFPCCGNFICEGNENEKNCAADCDVLQEKDVVLMTRMEILDKAKQLLKSSAKEAGDFCFSVPDMSKEDECFRILAYEGENKIFCTYVNDTAKRDNCYMEFAMEYDYSVCPMIDNKYLRTSCEALKKRPSPN